MIAFNLVLGALLLIVLSQSYHQEPSRVVEIEVEQQEVPDLIKTVEDRCKAINFVIGRVYSVHHGASKGLRERIKVDNDWYNELTEALEDPDENKNIIVGALEKIRRRLRVLEQSEAEVFTDAELGSLKKLERDSGGNSRIIDVLAQNDSDPVEGFHKAALEYCDLLLERLAA